jgi:hypothetical protein
MSPPPSESNRASSETMASAISAKMAALITFLTTMPTTKNDLLAPPLRDLLKRIMVDPRPKRAKEKAVRNDPRRPTFACAMRADCEEDKPQ